MENFFNQKENRLLGSLVLLMLLIALGAYASATFKQSQYWFTGPTSIMVSGEAEVVAVPDIGQFSFAVEGSSEAAAEARSIAAEKVNDILAFLKEAGVAESDIKTEAYNLNPKYRFEQGPCPIGTWCPPGEQIADGFDVSQSVRVKVRDIDKAGELISGVSERGVQNISSLQFTVDDTESLKTEARLAAIANAQAKSGPLAKELGVSVVRMTGYFEEDDYYNPYASDEMFMRSSVAMDGGVNPELPVGEQTVRSRVTITYEVK